MESYIRDRNGICRRREGTGWPGGGGVAERRAGFQKLVILSWIGDG
jgi:hypothetical protein